MDIKAIRDQLLEKKRELHKESVRVEKALQALEGDPKPPAAKKSASKPPDGAEAPKAPKELKREDVLKVCEGEFCNAERVGMTLDVSPSRASQVLSSLFAAGKLEREGERGSYYYKTRTVAAESPFKRPEES